MTHNIIVESLQHNLYDIYSLMCIDIFSQHHIVASVVYLMSKVLPDPAIKTYNNTYIMVQLPILQYNCDIYRHMVQYIVDTVALKMTS